MKRKAIIGVGIAGHPIAAAGNTWAFLQWVAGFQQLGWDVWLVEEIQSDHCIDAAFKPCPFEQSENLRYWRQITAPFQASLFVDGATSNQKDFSLFARDAEVFLNISGHLKQHQYLAHIPHRIYLDLDPAFTQVWASAYNCDMNFTGHNHFFSVGSCMKTARVPDTGHEWKPTLPPVDLNFWKPYTPTSPHIDPKNCWTTVTHWYAYADIEWNGMALSNKASEFNKIVDLPSRAPSSLMLATDLTPENEEYHQFSRAGWQMASASAVSQNQNIYRDFLASSRGEFSVAKGGYVASKCGWFSDRSACYLALGRPVILQETGWTKALEADEGLLSFTDAESAATSLAKVEADYDAHCRAARRLAEEKLDAQKVVGRMLKAIAC
ncbi:MAG: hypothetical protein V1746_08280 [bacterium]